MKNLFVYFLIINIIAFFVAGYDKFQARKNKYRIPEHTLLTFAIGGGSLGLVLAMLIFRHKISKTSFIVKFFAIFSCKLFWLQPN